MAQPLPEPALVEARPLCHFFARRDPQFMQRGIQTELVTEGADGAVQSRGDASGNPLNVLLEFVPIESAAWCHGQSWLWQMLPDATRCMGVGLAQRSRRDEWEGRRVRPVPPRVAGCVRPFAYRLPIKLQTEDVAIYKSLSRWLLAENLAVSIKEGGI